MKLVSLAAKERVAGVLDASARLARERRIHSKGLVPDEWKPVAALPPTTPASAEAVGSPGRAASVKSEPCLPSLKMFLADYFPRSTFSDQ
jgi:hypothetical protein